MGRNVSHSPQLQRGRSQNNLLFRLHFRAARQSLKVTEWVQGHRRLLLRSHLIPLVPPSPSSMLATLQSSEQGTASGHWQHALLLQLAPTSSSVQAATGRCCPSSPVP